MKKIGYIIIFIVALSLLSGCREREKIQTLNVFAASSLTDVLSEIKGIYEGQSNIKLQFNFAASGTLQKQIEEGAPADVFISAGVKQMDELETKGLIIRETRRDLIKNTLVLIGTKGISGVFNSIDDLNLGDIKYIGVATPETVPAGMYTKETLQYFQLWEKLEDKYVFTKDVRQVLTYVESGNTEVGFVYLSDAKLAKTAEVLLEIPVDAHRPILYPIALVNKENGIEGNKFLDFLVGDEAKKIFEKHGYVSITN